MSVYIWAHEDHITARADIAFGERFSDAKVQFDVWWAEVKRVKWQTPTDIKAQYGTASILKGGRVAFNICDNKYQLIVNFEYKKD